MLIDKRTKNKQKRTDGITPISKGRAKKCKTCNLGYIIVSML